MHLPQDVDIDAGKWSDEDLRTLFSWMLDPEKHQERHKNQKNCWSHVSVFVLLRRREETLSCTRRSTDSLRVNDQLIQFRDSTSISMPSTRALSTPRTILAEEMVTQRARTRIRQRQRSSRRASPTSRLLGYSTCLTNGKFCLPTFLPASMLTYHSMNLLWPSTYLPWKGRKGSRSFYEIWRWLAPACHTQYTTSVEYCRHF